MIKIKSIPPATLAQLANDHFESLNKRVQSGPNRGNYYVYSVINKIKNNIVSHLGDEKRFFHFLLGGDSYNRLKKILMGSPQELQNIVDLFNSRFPGMSFRELDTNNNWVFNSLGKKVIEIFNYTNYRRSKSCIIHLKAIGFGSKMPCPYCNCNALRLITIEDTITNEDYDQALLDLDHFFPKSKYPFLAISLFNLIPSCNDCNARIKRDQEFKLNTHIHPYNISFDEEFSFKLNSPYFSGQKADELVIEFESVNGFPDNSIIDLRLIERYNADREDLIRMLQILYKKPFINMRTIFGNLIDYNENRKLLLEFAGIPSEREDISNYILGKLKRDILVDLDMYDA